MARRVMRALGHAMQGAIQAGIALIGRPVDPTATPWLDGPRGDDDGAIGPRVYHRFAARTGLHLRDGTPDAGLLADFGRLAGDHFDPGRVHPEVRRFYEHTAAYDLDVWSEWHGVLTPFARLLVALVSAPMEQFNLPLTPLATSRGVSSDILAFADDAGGRPYAGWLRRNEATGAVIYAGFYTTCRPPGANTPCVKVVFPVPAGATTVILRPQNGMDGALILLSHGARFGDPGFYRLHRPRRGQPRVAYVPLHEVFTVYPAEANTVRTDHTLYFAGVKFLTLHYHIRRKDGHALPACAGAGR